MNSVRLPLVFALALSVTSLAARAQTSEAPVPPAVKQAGEGCGLPTRDTIHTYYLANATQHNDGNELQTSLRNFLPPTVKIYYDASQNAILVCGDSGIQALAQKVIHDLDRPTKAYRLTYTWTETEAGKRVGSQHFTMIVSAGQRSTMKVGSKVPVATGSYSAVGGSSIAGVQTQFQYLDVGMNFDATFTETASGGLLKTKVEESSADEDKTITGVNEPIVRQVVYEGSPMLILGKPAMLGTLDVPHSTRHEDLEVMAEEIK